MAGRGILAIDSFGGSFLYYPWEVFRQMFCGIAGDPAGDDVTRQIEEGIGLVVAIFGTELAVVLYAIRYRHLVFSADGDR